MPATLSTLDRDPPASGRSRVGALGVRRQGEGPLLEWPPSRGLVGFNYWY